MSSGDARSAIARDGGTEVHVGVAEYAVSSTGAELVTSGIGSCLAVGLYDDAAGVGGLVHPMLPERRSDRGPDGKYVEPGIDQLLGALEDAGATRRDVVAKIAGGACILSTAGEGIGGRNVAVAESRLDALDVQVLGTDVGGDQGRTVALDTASGVMVVKRAHGEHLQI